MKKIIALFFFLFLFQMGIGQNLVPNGSFEQYSSCPYTTGQIERAVPWFQPCLSCGSTDFYDSCAPKTSLVSVPENIAGYQNAHSGNGYAGFSGYGNYHNGGYDLGREYLEINLLNPLQEGKNYFVSFYVSRADSSQYAIDAIGSYFSVDTVQNMGFKALSQFIPQIINTQGNIIRDTLNWVLISGSFVANGNERFITIGNFFPDSLTAVDSTGPTYNVNYEFGYYYIDDVSVVEDTTTTGILEATLEKGISISPNPTKDNFTISFSQSVHEPTVMIFNNLGEKVFEKNVSGVVKEIPVHFSAAAGVYFLKVRDEERQWVEKIAVE